MKTVNVLAAIICDDYANEAARWVTKDTIDELDWLPADEELVKDIKSSLK